MYTQALKILIVEDDPISAEDIKQSMIELGHHPIGPAYDIEKAKSLIDSQHPALALLDIQLNEQMDGIELAKWIKSKNPIPIIFLTAFVDEITLNLAKEVHPEQYLIKPFNLPQLKAAIEIVASNYYNPDHTTLTKYKLQRLNEQYDFALTDRELEVLELLDTGLSNRAIANTLYISEHTVKSHLKNIFIKTEVKSRAALIYKINS